MYAVPRSPTDPDPDGNVSQGGPHTHYAYDAAGERVSLTDPPTTANTTGNTTTWTYDYLGRMIEESNALNLHMYYEYDALGRMARQIDRRGKVRDFQYDNLSRNTHEYWYNSVSAADVDTNRTAATNTLSFAYDVAGQLLSAGDSNADYAYSYDSLGRMISINQDITGLSDPVILTEKYDAAGRRTNLSASFGTGTIVKDFVNDYLYDNLNRLTQVKQQGASGGNAVAPKVIDLAYDLDGQFNTIKRYADLAKTELVVTGAYGFDAAGRLVGLGYTDGAASGLTDYIWEYDAAGRMTYYANSIDGSVHYANDNTWQLTGADYYYFHKAEGEDEGFSADESYNYNYDENGNRTTASGQTYTTNTNNRLTSDGIYNYEYDDNGNRMVRTKISDGSVTRYIWDNRNRLTRIATYADGTTSTPIQVIKLSYDYMDRWIGRNVYNEVDPDINPSAVPADQTRFVYDGNQIIEQFDKSGGGNLDAGDLTHRYLYGPAVDQILADEVVNTGSAADVHWTLTDHQNTVRDIVTYNSGTQTTSIVNHLVYNAFGELKSSTPGGPDCLLGYTGRPIEEFSGIQNNGERWYDALIGRWLSEDPSGLTPDVNDYRYCHNAPTIYVDPRGLKDYKIGKGPRPTIKWDNGYAYDPNAKPTWSDTYNWYKYATLLLGAEAWGHLPDGTRAYAHYRDATGTDLSVDYNKAIRNDSGISNGFSAELVGAQADIEREHDGKTKQFSVYSTTARMVNSSTENWQKALGGHDIWGTGSVTFDASKCEYTLNIAVEMEDFYNFNKGQADIATGLPDDQNGRFEVFGWAKSFFSRGHVTRTITWKRGHTGTTTQIDGVPRR